MNAIISQIHSELLKNADEKVAQSMQRFFKEEIKSIGLKAKTVGTIAKSAYKDYLKNADKTTVYAVAEKLMQSPFIEEISIGIHFVIFSEKLYEKNDIKIFEHWIETYITNWATCDSFCNHAVGVLVERFPENIKTLKRWSKSKNIWLRRTSAVSLIVPSRKGLFFDDILEIAETLLLDEEDMVQKGYGWLLKTSSLTESFVKADTATKEKHFKSVFNFVMKHKAVIPRTSLRYAIEKFPEKERKLCMAK
ncbi:MAG: DNA alkylation repair protein [Dysgonamonadaceae bacterium]|jgi:3-methyladenine DNA glycosylase AlkD|nr:DNA alkylation repair protein [Dysgonamonadaceae bacterium]